MIKPTIGRKVWFWFNPKGYLDPPRLVQHDTLQPLDATIVYVWGDHMVNLDVVDHTGLHWPMTSVVLVHPEEPKPEHSFCAWMPYQVGQAEKTKEVLSEADKAKHESIFQPAQQARAAGPSSY